MVRFLDTFILLYSISRDQRELAKCAQARFLAEFDMQATRTMRRDALPPDIAVGLIESSLRFPLKHLTRGVLLDALAIMGTVLSSRPRTHWAVANSTPTT